VGLKSATPVMRWQPWPLGGIECPTGERICPLVVKSASITSRGICQSAGSQCVPNGDPIGRGKYRLDRHHDGAGGIHPNLPARVILSNLIRDRERRDTYRGAAHAAPELAGRLVDRLSENGCLDYLRLLISESFAFGVHNECLCVAELPRSQQACGPDKP
jgi:hypothetical protein